MPSISTIILLTTIAKTTQDTVCGKSWSTTYGVEWPMTADKQCSVSSDPCLNPSKEFLKRCCSNGMWLSEPQCFYVQKPLPQCPEDFQENTQYQICYKFTEPSTYPPKCPYEDTVPFSEYQDIIPSNKRPVWMPVQRNVSSGLGFLQWIEPSAEYKSNFKGKYYATHPIIDKNCLLYYNSSYIVAASCNDQHTAICAYRKLDGFTNKLCSSQALCRQSDFTSKSRCFCVGSSYQPQSDKKKVEFIKPYQNHIYYTLTNDICAIGLEKTAQGKYIWANSGREIAYTYWSPDVVFDSSHRYGAATPNGWILTANELEYPCYLYEEEIDKTDPKLGLVFDKINNKLRLSVKDPNGLKWLDESTLLVFCFTDAGSFNLLYRYPYLTEISTGQVNELRFEFIPHTTGPGYYWCESFKYPDLAPLASNTVFLRQENVFFAEFIAILCVDYIDGTDPLSEQIIEFLERILFIKLGQTDHLQKFYTARILKIIYVNEDDNKIYVNVHFTSKVKESADNLEEEYELVKKVIGEALNDLEQIQISMRDFHSPDFCMGEETSYLGVDLTWPTVSLGQTAMSLEYCFKNNGVRMSRLCAGGFVDGARWANIEHECQTLPSSTVTDLLKQLIDSALTPSERINSLREISTRFPEFLPIDVYLTAMVLGQVSTDPRVDLTILVGIIDNLHRIERSILQEGQGKTIATDLLLIQVQEILLSHKYEAPIDISGEYFHLIIYDLNVKDLTAIIIQDQFSVTILDGDVDWNDIKSYSDLNSAVLLSNELKAQIKTKDKLIVTIHSNDDFFNEAVEANSPIFGLILPDDLTEFAGDLTLMHLDQGDEKNSCVYWRFGRDSVFKGLWQQDSQSDITLPYIFCHFHHQKYFSIVHAEDTCDDIADPCNDVTTSLQDLLQSNKTVDEIMRSLVNISARYNEFGYFDVYLVGEVLRKICTDDGIDLLELAQIISNLQEINRDVLSQSQMKKQATDRILRVIDEILKNHRYESHIEVMADNFIAIISDVKETNITGLLLKTSNNSFQFETLYGNINIDDLTELDQLESTVVIDDELKLQLINDSKIIITAFAKDVLFNEQKSQNQFISKIFGVIVPDIQGEFPGPISILHRIQPNSYEGSCEFWLYDQKGSLWKRDSASKVTPPLTLCEFYHTTHFALLLLGDDKYNSAILDWITTINCGLSLMGLLGIVLTGIIFKRWRNNTGNQILMNFVLAMSLQIGTFYISGIVNQHSDDPLLCTIIGVVLHYSLVSQFCWMFVIAILQFKRFVEVLGGPPKYILVKACLCGWILPLLPVLCVLLLDQKNYVGGNVGLCYPSGLGLYLGVWLPLAIIVLINLVIFVYIIYHVVHRNTECVDTVNDETLFQWRLAVLLFFMLGLTWSFGFLSELDFGEIFVYLFCFTATLQGFIMFLFFIVFNKNTRQLYVYSIKRCCYDPKYN